MNEFMYVRHEDVERFIADGWTMVDDLAGTHHGEYAVLMGRMAA